MKTTVKKIYRAEMSPETAECILALIYCNLCSAEASPLDSLFCELKEALNLDDEGLTRLATRYKEFM